MEQETKRCPYCGEEILAIAKKCKHCGEWLSEKKTEEKPKQMTPCPICSELIEEGTEICPHCHERLGETIKQDHTTLSGIEKNKQCKEYDNSRSFFDYYIVEPFLRNYATFNARLNRKHYFVGLSVWTITFLALFLVFAGAMEDDTPFVYQIIVTGLFGFFCIGSIIPLYATATRRLRDADSAPSSIAWGLLVFASPLILFWICKTSEDEEVRIDGLEADVPQKVAFKKNDVIICAVLILFFVLGLALNSGLWGDKAPVPTTIDETSQITDLNSDDDTDNSFLKVGEALDILNTVEEYAEEVNSETRLKIKELLLEKYQFERGENEWLRPYGEVWVFYKNCSPEEDVIIDKDNACEVNLALMGVSPQVSIKVFNKQRLESLKQQLDEYGFIFEDAINDSFDIYKNEKYRASVLWNAEDKYGEIDITRQIK